MDGVIIIIIVIYPVRSSGLEPNQRPLGLSALVNLFGPMSSTIVE